jgi:hypothetical protein
MEDDAAAAVSPPPPPAPPPHGAIAAGASAPIGVSLRALSLYLERRPLLARSASSSSSSSNASSGASGLCILRDVTGEIPAGSLFLIIGGSGSGKTSLLNALAMRLPSVGYRLEGARACALALRCAFCVSVMRCVARLRGLVASRHAGCRAGIAAAARVCDLRRAASRRAARARRKNGGRTAHGARGGRHHRGRRRRKCQPRVQFLGLVGCFFVRRAPLTPPPRASLRPQAPRCSTARLRTRRCAAAWGTCSRWTSCCRF